MRNTFLAVGQLNEAAIHFYSTHAKIRLTLDVSDKIIQIQQTISRKWAKQQYDDLCAMIPYLHPRIDGRVLKNGKEQIYTIATDNTQTELFVSGNISEWKGQIYFNACYMRLTQNASHGLKIELDGQWAGKDRFINICGDWPREFFINAPIGCEQRVYRLTLDYNPGYAVHDNMVTKMDGGLKIINCKSLDEYIDDEQMKKILLELEIMLDN